MLSLSHNIFKIKSINNFYPLSDPKHSLNPTPTLVRVKFEIWISKKKIFSFSNPQLHLNPTPNLPFVLSLSHNIFQIKSITDLYPLHDPQHSLNPTPTLVCVRFEMLIFKIKNIFFSQPLPSPEPHPRPTMC